MKSDTHFVKSKDVTEDMLPKDIETDRTLAKVKFIFCPDNSAYLLPHLCLGPIKKGYWQTM